MKISVVMPVYNGEKYLSEAIDSILDQTFSDFEFIIINDCSTDNTEDIIKSYTDNRIRYIKNNKNLGVAESLNKGLELAKGEYIARMDADDISLPQRFEKQVKFLDLHKEYGLCGTDVIRFGEHCDDIRVFSHDNDHLKVDLIFGCALAHPTVMLRKSISSVTELRYDKAYEKAEDFELWTRIAEKVKICVLNEPLLKYRIHSMQVSVSCNIQQCEACKKIRYNTLLKILGINSANKYIDVFDKYCNNQKMTSEDYDLFLDCLNAMLTENKKNKIYNQKILCEQLFYIKNSISNKNNRKLSMQTWYEYFLFIKTILSALLKR